MGVAVVQSVFGWCLAVSLVAPKGVVVLQDIGNQVLASIDDWVIGHVLLMLMFGNGSHS